MFLGTYIKSNIRYEGKALCTENDIDEERKNLEKDCDKLWGEITKYIYTSPNDYISKYGEHDWQDYDSVTSIILRKIRGYRTLIEDNISRQCKLTLIRSEFENEIKVNGPLTSSCIGKKLHSAFYLVFGENPFVSTERVCRPFFRDKKYTDITQIASDNKEDRNNMNSQWMEFEFLAIQNLNSFLHTKDNYGSIMESMEQVRQFLYEKSDEIRKDISELIWQIEKKEIILNDKDSAQEYMDNKAKADNLRKEWIDKKKAVFNDVLKTFGVQIYDDNTNRIPTHLIRNRYKELLKEKGLDVDPAKDFEDIY